MAPKELKILRLLMEHPQGLFASELVHLSDGYLTRTSVYTLLRRVIDKGYVTETEEPATAAYMLPRWRHSITAAGRRSVSEYAAEMGFGILGNSLAGGVT